MRISLAFLASVLAACAGAETGTSDTGPCGAGLVRCGGTCIDPMTDPMYCGAGGTCAGDSAGMVCEAGATCESGSCAAPCMTATQTFVFTGGMQVYQVPSGVASVRIDASGAQGADANGGTTPGIGGRGGRAAGSLAVTPGQQLVVFVGGRNGFNGGGTGGAGSTISGNGGGASDVRTGMALGERVIVAGGGGGGGGGPQGGCVGVGGAGGAGGGAAGANGTGCDTTIAGPGGAGTATEGGAGGTPGTNCGVTAFAGVVGANLVGGAGGAGAMCSTGGLRGSGGGGGGAGYFGGGGGAGGTGGSGGSWGGGGGGGGASWVGTLTDATMTPGMRQGDGIVTITTICP